MIDWTKFPSSLPLATIFAFLDAGKLEHELGNHCFMKRVRFVQELTEAEATFDFIQHIGGIIGGDGFISLFHQSFTRDSFVKVCKALTEVGGIKLRDLLYEAWNIYTKGKDPITIDELQSISVRRFNTKGKMDRFDQIGEEVMAEIREQYAMGRVWSVEYAKLHRDEFEPV